ncbi:hypothetical protein [uncultured Prevotellamassilia sp.]|uniref:hypothetical protein n=1 Tax=uncultured Prevotellamassilia sp. TaxID=1926676 RepID=UPI00259A3ABD|nr:hypothetical protein [uncultured Prevotellamassilia sp.]
MKKITTLLLLCTVASSSALAQTNPVVNTGGEAYAKAYVAGSYNRGGFLAQSGDNLKHVSQSAYTYWFLQNGTAGGSVQLINVRTGKGISVNAADGTFNLAGTTADLYVLGNNFNNYGLCISNANPISENSCIDARNDGDGCGKYDPRDNDWDGTTWVFHEAPGYFVSAAQGLKPVTTEQYHFDSKVINLPKATKKLRFRVVGTVQGKNGGGPNDPSGLYPFFTMAEFYLYDAEGNKVTLTADNFKTNAQETVSNSDKVNTVAHLCDDDNTTIFHSSYSTTPNTYHYIEVTLPTAMQSFKFSFDGRSTATNVPAMIQIFDDDAIAKANVEDQVLQGRPSLQSLYNSTNYSFGSNYQQYTYNGDQSEFTSARAAVNEVLSKYSGAVTLDEFNTAKTNLESAVAKATLNTPADGSYIRIRATSSADAGMPYLTSDLSDVEKMTTRAALVSGANDAANSIFYYKDQKLIAYGTGYKATSNSNFLGYNGIADGTVVTFKAATEATSEYNVFFNNGDRKLYTQVSDGKYYTDAYSKDDNHNRCRFWLEKVNSLPVSVSAAGYATLFAPVALTIPENVQAYTATFADNKVTLTPIEGTIPANTGVVIEAAKGNYNFAITTTEATATSDLTGNVATANVDAASAAYILGKTDAQGVGFFKLNSTDRAIKGGRAYYVAPNGGAAAYLFNGNVTGLEAIKTALNDANAPIYDLSGRKVAKAVKGGLYIKNGQKFIVK